MNASARGTRRRGAEAEAAVSRFLQKQGLELLASNYRAPGGEIDLVMRDQDTIVFVEVRSRANTGFVHPAETIDEHKQKHILLAGERYLQGHGLLDKVNSRFDVVAVTGPNNARKIEWIKNAFDA